jgi:hypothetical protein
MLKSIIEFQKAGGHTVAYTTDNHTPSIDDRKLRLKLIFEELTELAEAYGLEKTFLNIAKKLIYETELSMIESIDTKEFNRTEALDALCDLSVVVNGGYCISGFTNIAEEAYEETMKSNMSKFCYSLDEALVTVANKEDWTYKQVVVDDKIIYAILRKEDGKIMKSSSFFKPDYNKFLNNLNNN